MPHAPRSPALPAQPNHDQLSETGQAPGETIMIRTRAAHSHHSGALAVHVHDSSSMRYWNGSRLHDREVYHDPLAASTAYCACQYACLDTYVYQELEPQRGIGDEQIHGSAPLVRALLVERLEQIWSVCEPHVTGGVPKPDPRFIEAGIRVLDRLAKLYRLDQPVPQSQELDGELIDKATLVLAGLRELEARMEDAVS